MIMMDNSIGYNESILFNDVYFSYPVAVLDDADINDIMNTIFDNLCVPYLVVDNDNEEPFVKVKQHLLKTNPDIQIDKVIFSIGYHKPFNC